MNDSYRFLRSRLLVAGISLAAIAGATCVSAAEAGRVLFASGDVRIIATDGSRRAAKRGDIVQDGERMQTGQGALGQVRMVDGERVGVRGGSKIRFAPPPANPAQPRQLELESGGVRVLNIAGRGKPEMKPVEVKTPDGELLMNGADVVVRFVRDSGAAEKVGDAAAGKPAPAARKVQARINRSTVQAPRGGQRLAMAVGEIAKFSQGKLERVTNRLNGLEPPSQPQTRLSPSDKAEDQKLGRDPNTPKGPIGRTPGSFPRSVPRGPLVDNKILGPNFKRLAINPPIVPPGKLAIPLGESPISIKPAPRAAAAAAGELNGKIEALATRRGTRLRLPAARSKPSSSSVDLFRTFKTMTLRCVTDRSGKTTCKR
ncbi:MAG: hypothetical protein ACI9DC_000968 [Gammaproteobacteria bacterium]|jgi:hypothetical protein